MGIFNKARPIDWQQAYKATVATLFAVFSTDFEALASPYARLVLTNASKIDFYSDVRNIRYVLGWGDLTAILLHEEHDALVVWAKNCVAAEGDTLAMLIHTEIFSKILITALQSKVQRLGRG